MTFVYAVLKLYRNGGECISVWPTYSHAQVEAERLAADWDWNHTPADWRAARDRHFNDVRSEMGRAYDRDNKDAIDREVERRTVAEKGPKPRPDRDQQAEFVVSTAPLIYPNLLQR